jgi:hypothetical protein
MPIILDTWEAEMGRIAFRRQPRQIVRETPSPKSNQRKTDWRCGSVVENLLCKCEALSSNTSGGEGGEEEIIIANSYPDYQKLRRASGFLPKQSVVKFPNPTIG